MKNLYRCLIVEDEVYSAQLLGEFLKEYRNFYTPRFAQNLAQAGAEIKNQSFDLILCDIHLPDGNAMRFLKSFEVKTPVILITGDTKLSLEAYEMDIIDYIIKPVSRKRFDKAVVKALEVILGRKELQKIKRKPENSKKKDHLEKILMIRYHLTPAESAICLSINEGKTVNEILEIHSISSNTYKTHMKNIFSKTIDLNMQYPREQRKLQRLTIFLFSLNKNGF